MVKVRVIIKRPDERYGHVTNISVTLENIKKIVGGYVEPLRIADQTVILCNEDGKRLGLKPNMYVGNFPYGQLILGDLIVIGTDEEEFADCPLDFKTWKWLVDKWGNC